MVDEAWERAVEAALHAGGEGSSSPARSLTLDGAVKCMHGRLPAAEILERHQSLEHLSIAGVGVTSLEGFPRLRNLTRLTLSDNRIAGGLDHLVAAGLSSLRDLDLSNNRIQDVDDLAPLADLRLVSLDLYECPVTRVKDYRSRVFGMIRTLKYLDKMDADENERPESDDDDDDGDGDGEGEGEGDGDGDEDDDDEEDEDDPGSGEVANGGVSHARGVVASHPVEENGVIDVDEEESDADEVVPNGVVEHHHGPNGFRVAAAGEVPEEEDEDVEDDDEDDDEDFEEEDDLGEEIDEDGDDEDAVVEVHDVPSSEDEDGVEEDEDDEDEEEEEVEDEEEEAEPQSSGRVAMMTGEDGGEEIDGHEHGEGDDEDENGEIGEEDEEGLGGDRVYEEGNDDEDADDEDEDTEYLVQPIAQPQPVAIGSDFDAADPDDADEDRDEVDDDDEGATDQPSSSQGTKRCLCADPHLITQSTQARGARAPTQAHVAIRPEDSEMKSRARSSGADSRLSVRKSKAEKDPNKPKRPPSAFFVFMEEFRKDYKEKHPNVKQVSVIGKAGGDKWKSLSDAEKAPFVSKAEKLKVEYTKKMDAYNNKQSGGPTASGDSDKSKSEVDEEGDE